MPLSSTYALMSTSAPFRVAECTRSATMSTHVRSPARALANRTVVFDAKVFSPGPPWPSVRSSSMS